MDDAAGERASELVRLQERLRQFVAERDWGRFHDPKNLAMLLASEAGELVAELRWVANEDADQFVADPAVFARVEAELADVTIAVLLLADRLGVDLLDAVEQKIAVNAVNYPAGSGHEKTDHRRTNRTGTQSHAAEVESVPPRATQ